MKKPHGTTTIQDAEERAATVPWGTCHTPSFEVSPFPQAEMDDMVTEPCEQGTLTPVSGAGVFACDLEERTDRLCLSALASAIRDEEECIEPAPAGLQDSARGWGHHGPHFVSVFWA